MTLCAVKLSMPVTRRQPHVVRVHSPAMCLIITEGITAELGDGLVSLEQAPRDRQPLDAQVPSKGLGGEFCEVQKDYSILFHGMTKNLSSVVG